MNTCEMHFWGLIASLCRHAGFYKCVHYTYEYTRKISKRVKTL